MDSSCLWMIVLAVTTVTAGTRHGTRYTLYSRTMSQPAATTHCEQRGDRLLTFKTPDKFNSFREIKNIWVDEGKLVGDFWVSLKKNGDHQYWHDGSMNTNNLGFTVVDFISEELCFRFFLAETPPPLRDHMCTKEIQVICERDMGLCTFEKFAETTIDESVTKKDVGKMSVEACQGQCLDYNVTGEECSGVETDQSGLCYLLIGTKVFIGSVTTQINPAITLYVKRCYQMQEYGNPSLPFTFHLSDFTLDWDQAKAFCELSGLNMVKLDTQSKIDAFSIVFSQWSRDGKILGDVWSGLRDRDDSGTGDYIWTDEQPLSTISNWDQGEPNYQHIEFCVRLTSGSQAWKTRECWREFQVVCEESAAECTYTDILKTPEESPSVSVSGVTEAECQSKCRTTAQGGDECSVYRYGGNTCDMYMGTVTLTTSLTRSKQKKCYFGEAPTHENIGKKYSFYNLTKTKADADTFCDNIGEGLLLLNVSTDYSVFLQILQDRTDLPILDNIWMTPASPSVTMCDVIVKDVTPYSSTMSCDLTAQVVCLSTRGDCTYIEHVNTNLASSVFLPMPGRNVDYCKAQCDKTKAGNRICAGIVHDGNVDCQLIMRQDTYINTPSDLVTENGKTLYYINCNEAVFLGRTTISREYSVHRIRQPKSGAESFCAQIGASSLLPSTLPELTALLQVISHLGGLGLLSESQHVWTGLRGLNMGRAYRPLKSVEDNSGSDCVALNHHTSTWTPLTCTNMTYVVCQTDKGSCTMEEYANHALSVRDGAMLFSAADAEACQTWCSDLSVTYAECVAVEFDGTDCSVHFADSVYVTSTPAMTSSVSSTVFIRRCYTFVTPDASNLLSYNFVMFDTLLTHTDSRDACSTLGLEMLKLDNDSSQALSKTVNRTNNIWLGLTAGFISHTWTDGQALSWVNWQSTIPPSDQCVALDKYSPNLTWIGQDCSQTNFALCNNGTGDCVYTSHPGKKLPSVESGVALVIESKRESSCQTACVDVRVGTTRCRGVSIRNTQCYLDMGEELYVTEPALVEDVQYNTSIRVCNEVKVEPYTAPETSTAVMSTTDSSFTPDATSSSVPEKCSSGILTPEISTTGVSLTSEEISLLEDDVETSSISTMEETYFTQLEPSGGVQTAPTVENLLETNTAGPSVSVSDTLLIMSIDNSQAEWMGTDTAAQVHASSDDTQDVTATNMGGSGAAGPSSLMSGQSSVGGLVPSGGNGGRYVYQVCICRCRVQLPDTPILMSIEIRGIRTSLLLNRRNLSSYIRTKMSVPNRKKSAVAVGSGLGIAIMVTLLIFLFALDIDNFLMVVKMCKNSDN